MAPLKVGLVQFNIGWDYEDREAVDAEGSHYASTFILPYSVALLQAYAQRYAKDASRYEFLLPLHRRVPMAAALARLEGADVVAVSSYVWNEQLSLALAAELKARRPETLVVFGGPQVP